MMKCVAMDNNGVLENLNVINKTRLDYEKALRELEKVTRVLKKENMNRDRLIFRYTR